jgi:hypothetical protein
LDRNVSLPRASPDQGNHPADDGPAKEQIHKKDANGVGFVPPNNSRQEVQQDREKQEEHFKLL